MKTLEKAIRRFEKKYGPSYRFPRGAGKKVSPEILQRTREELRKRRKKSGEYTLVSVPDLWLWFGRKPIIHHGAGSETEKVHSWRGVTTKILKKAQCGEWTQREWRRRFNKQKELYALGAPVAKPINLHGNRWKEKYAGPAVWRLVREIKDEKELLRIVRGYKKSVDKLLKCGFWGEETELVNAHVNEKNGEVRFTDSREVYPVGEQRSLYRTGALSELYFTIKNNSPVANKKEVMKKVKRILLGL